MFIGVLLLILGVLMLLNKLGVIHGGVWDYFWPVAIIALGASMLVSAKKKRHD